MKADSEMVYKLPVRISIMYRDAWNKLGNQNKLQSAQEYIDRLYNADPDWLEKVCVAVMKHYKIFSCSTCLFDVHRMLLWVGFNSKAWLKAMFYI